MSGEALRAALVGLGRAAWRYPPAGRAGAASTHLESYGVLGLRCVAGCDPDAAASRRFAEATGLPVHAELAELLRKHPLDVLSICSPDAVHHEQAMLALRQGVRRIWLEKPPAGSAALTRELAALAERSGASVAVNFFRRYHPCFQEIRALVASEELGPLRLIRIQYSRGLLTNGIHQLDLLHFVTGDEREFSVDAATRDAHGNADALLRSGELRVQVSGAALPWHVQEMEILCERGRIRASRGGAELRVDLAKANPDYPEFMQLEEGERTERYENPGHSFPLVLKDLLDSDARRPPRSHLGTAARAMDLYEAILQRADGDPRRGG